MNPENAKQLSVIICTHNPRRDYFERTLAALRSQTLPLDNWELMIVDNASKPALAETLDLSWHKQSRIVLEPELGILPGRLRGITESDTPFILFVDDDNVLAPDYLEEALKIAATHPFLGIWGGCIKPEFETPPPPWIGIYLPLLACVDITEDRWWNFKTSHATPPTAGMCLRRFVAESFFTLVKNDPRRRFLGRRGKAGLTNCEDTDLALTCCDIGLGLGQFARLKLTHLIPTSRLNEDYLLRITEGTHYSSVILDALRGNPPVPYPRSPLRAALGKLNRWLFWERRRRLIFERQLKARKLACAECGKWE
jgi:glycosyltransferase involved in cell wall biosynthesis